MDFAVYVAYRIFVGVLTALPLPFNFLLGKSLGALSYFILRPYRRLVIANLTIAFGDEKSARAIRELARAHFMNLGANLLSSVKLASMSKEAIDARTRWEN